MELQSKPVRPSGPRVNLLLTPSRSSGKASPLNRRVLVAALLAAASWAVAAVAVARLLGWHLPIGPGP